MDARNALFEVIDSSIKHPEYLFVAQKYLLEILKKSDQENQADKIKESLVDEKTLNLEIVSAFDV